MKIHDYLKESSKTLSQEEREERYKYLGKEVIDVNEPGLDSIAEFYGIVHAIWDDWADGRIDTKTALRRLALLKLLSFKGKNKKIQDIDDEDLEEVRKFIDYVRQIIKNKGRKRGEDISEE
ncbi:MULTISPECIES: hypothetical protein [Caldisericum]|jgi:hypothetical protein|uniref:Uncharacterized protein n=1 Tax=Caldisericum exile TaxID=693075 RepID=A0A2J6WEK6_9BACT|nr:MAG: hypothetical protein C0189_02780 [Caldisericum exile]